MSMYIELKQVSWEDYLKMSPAVRKLTGYPAYYTINEVGRCIVWPTPSEKVKLSARIE